MSMRGKRILTDVIIYIVLVLMSIIWLAPFVCIIQSREHMAGRICCSQSMGLGQLHKHTQYRLCKVVFKYLYHGAGCFCTSDDHRFMYELHPFEIPFQDA